MVRLGLLPSFILFQWALLCVLMLINTPEFCPGSATPPQALYMALAPVILTSHWFLAALGPDGDRPRGSCGSPGWTAVATLSWINMVLFGVRTSGNLTAPV